MLGFLESCQVDICSDEYPASYHEHSSFSRSLVLHNHLQTHPGRNLKREVRIDSIDSEEVEVNRVLVDRW